MKEIYQLGREELFSQYGDEKGLTSQRAEELL